MTAPLRAATLVWAVCLATASGAAESHVCSETTVTLNGSDGPVAFAVEIADDPAEQARGLMFRPALAPDAGMLFLYDAPQPAAFWMKNTMIPLDMIFLDEAGRVINVIASAEPYSLAPRRSEGPALAVLEINGGLAEMHGIGPGTQAVHPAFEAAEPPWRCAPAG